MRWCVNHWHESTIGRHSLSQPLRAASSLREGAGNGWFHSSGCSLKSGVSGDFHRPYATQKILVFTIHRGTLPQSALRAASSLREGAGNGWFHSTGYSLNRRVTGDFHRPYETQKFLHFTVQLGGMGKCLHNSRKKVDIITGKQEKIDFFVAICYNNTDR